MFAKTRILPEEVGILDKNGYRLFDKEAVGIGFFGRIFVGQPYAGKVESCDKLRFIKSSENAVGIKILYTDVGFKQLKPVTKAVTTEIEAMNRCFGNPYLLSLLDVFIGQKRVFLIYEYADKGNLTMLLRMEKKGRMNEQTALKYIYLAALGLKVLHSMGISHGDINPDNIFVTKDNEVKLGEFGFAKFDKKRLEDKDNFLNNEKSQKIQKDVFCGAINYSAPEVLDENNFDYDAKASDIWSLGITLYVLLNGRVPFIGQGKKEILSLQLRYFDNLEPLLFLSTISVDCRELVWNMLTGNSMYRPTVWDVLESKTMKKYKIDDDLSILTNSKNDQLLQILKNEEYRIQKMNVKTYLETRQKILREAYFAYRAKGDYGTLPLIAIPAPHTNKSEFWRLTMNRTVKLYGLPAFTECDPKKNKVLRDLPECKEWMKLKNSKEAAKVETAPSPSFGCSIQINEDTNSASVTHWLSVDYESVIKRNENALIPYKYEDAPPRSAIARKKFLGMAEKKNFRNINKMKVSRKTEKEKKANCESLPSSAVSPRQDEICSVQEAKTKNCDNAVACSTKLSMKVQNNKKKIIGNKINKMEILSRNKSEEAKKQQKAENPVKAKTKGDTNKTLKEKSLVKSPVMSLSAGGTLRKLSAIAKSSKPGAKKVLEKKEPKVMQKPLTKSKTKGFAKAANKVLKSQSNSIKRSFKLIDKKSSKEKKVISSEGKSENKNLESSPKSGLPLNTLKFIEEAKEDALSNLKNTYSQQ